MCKYDFSLTGQQQQLENHISHHKTADALLIMDVYMMKEMA